MKISKPLLKTIAAALAVGAISSTSCTKTTNWIDTTLEDAKMKIEQKRNPDPTFDCAACGMG